MGRYQWEKDARCFGDLVFQGQTHLQRDFPYCFVSFVFFMGGCGAKGKGSNDIISLCFWIHQITLLYLPLMTTGLSYVYYV
jgi:hypothetical protein